MATTEELLAQLEAEAQSETPVCVIDPETRTISVPPEYQLLGVENDKRVERIYFQCPKVVGDNQDLSQDYILFINYVNANGDPDAYHIDDMEIDGDNITFSWLLEENVTKYRGSIQFAFGAIIPGDTPEDPDKNRWNTTINTDCTCLIGLKSTQQVAESNPDALAQIWAAIDELKAGGGGGGTTDYNNLSNKPQLNGVTLEGNKTLDQVGVLAKNQGSSNSGKYLSVGSDGNVVPADAPSGGTVDQEQIKQAVNDYLEENPPSGMTAEEKEQLDKNTEDISSLSEEIAKLQTSGLTTAQVNALDDMFKKCAFTGNVSAEYTAFKQAFGIESGGGEEEPTDKTLTSISVTYAGGEVTVGTALTDLTGITVTAHYSDGSTTIIAGYILSGEIVEGENTIMVSYEGKTTTFTVVGYVEEAETTEPVYRLAEATTFDGTNTVDTGYALCENYKAFTVVVDFTSTTKSGSVFGCDKNASYGVGVKCQSGYYWSAYWGVNVNKDVSNASNGVKYVITHKANSNIAKAYYIYEDALTTQEFTIFEGNYNAHMNFTNTVILGSGFTGIINDFKIYESVLSQEEINAYVGV